MKKNILKIAACGILIFTTLFSIAAIRTNGKEEASKKAVETKKYRIGYCESLPYAEFPATFVSILKGMKSLGLLTGTEKIPYTKEQSDTKVIWDWLSRNDTGSKVEFVKDAFFDVKEMQDKYKDQAKGMIISRLKQNDLHLLITMGTMAGLTVANNEHNIPVMVFAASNAVQSKIIKSVDDSGFDHVWAHMDPNRYKRQIQVFYDIFKFKKLGMIYENSLPGRTYAALEDVQAVSKGKFDIISSYLDEPKTLVIGEEYYEKLFKIHSELSEKVDAVYITSSSCPDVKRMPKLLEPFYNKKIPVFAQLGENYVKHGALLSISDDGYSSTGKFGAQTIKKVLEGTLPRKLSQVNEDTPHIVLNFEVANKIGYKPPFDILLVSDQIFGKIETK